MTKVWTGIVVVAAVIGFAAITFNNGQIEGATGPIQSNYGGAFLHKQTRSIQ